MSRIEKGPSTGKSEVKKNTMSVDEASYRTAYFVMENLPEIPFLRKMAEDKRERKLTIRDEEWSLGIRDDEGIVSSGEIGEIRHIILTKENGEDQIRFGIFTEKDFGLALGSYLANSFIRFRKPVNLAKALKEIKQVGKKRVKKSLGQAQNTRKTAVAPNVVRHRRPHTH